MRLQTANFSTVHSKLVSLTLLTCKTRQWAASGLYWGRPELATPGFGRSFAGERNQSETGFRNPESVRKSRVFCYRDNSNYRHLPSKWFGRLRRYQNILTFKIHHQIKSLHNKLFCLFLAHEKAAKMFCGLKNIAPIHATGWAERIF